MNPGFLTLKKNCHNNTGNGAQMKGGQVRLLDLDPKESLRRDPILESLGRRKLGSVFIISLTSLQESGV